MFLKNVTYFVSISIKASNKLSITSFCSVDNFLTKDFKGLNSIILISSANGSMISIKH